MKAAEIKTSMNKLTEYFKYDLRRVMRPLAYHGAGKSGPFFEGWYFKLVSADGGCRLSIIPGVYTGQAEEDCHAFIQVMDSAAGSSHYLTFPYNDFSFVPGEMDVHLAGSHFTQQGISLDLHTDELDVQGEVRFSGLQPWPMRALSPGVMSWFAWVPGMECYHGIVSMDHSLQGSLRINGRRMDFDGGRGYMEKDWGRAMPRAWIWMQSNHFERAGTGFTFSIADIPWGNLHFKGFLGGLLLDGQLHRFATYTGARLRDFSLASDSVHFVLSDLRKRLAVTAHSAVGVDLRAPTLRQMDRRIQETLSAVIDLRFEQKVRGRWMEVFSGSGRYAGLERVGEL
ncbi:MAG: tocopherol cyclase [Chloroflexota bacterium]|nr:tocopherol cyclase [Chloroflexota bacterium]